MYKIPANTLFTGKNMVYVPECHSTNLLATALCQKNPLPDGSLILTDHQTSGRGQRGNTWMSSPGMNFTFSLVFRPTFLPITNQSLLTMTISVGICDYLIHHISETAIHVKWPNDIMVRNKKICGILIENQIQGSLMNASIVGIGLNVNQTQFDNEGATSLLLQTKKTFDLHKELGSLLSCIESKYLQLRDGKFGSIKSEYLSQLFWKDEPHLFKSQDKQFMGVIKDVDDGGKLLVEVAGNLQKFSLKEIQFIS